MQGDRARGDDEVRRRPGRHQSLARPRACCRTKVHEREGSGRGCGQVAGGLEFEADWANLAKSKVENNSSGMMLGPGIRRPASHIVLATAVGSIAGSAQGQSRRLGATQMTCRREAGMQNPEASITEAHRPHC